MKKDKLDYNIDLIIKMFKNRLSTNKLTIVLIKFIDDYYYKKVKYSTIGFLFGFIITILIYCVL